MDPNSSSEQKDRTREAKRDVYRELLEAAPKCRLDDMSMYWKSHPKLGVIWACPGYNGDYCPAARAFTPEQRELYELYTQTERGKLEASEVLRLTKDKRST